MPIMTAGVHVAIHRCKRQPSLLAHRQAVEVGAHHERVARPAAFQDSDQSGASNALMHFQSDVMQTLRNVRRRRSLLECSLRHGVQVAAHLHHRAKTVRDLSLYVVVRHQGFAYWPSRAAAFALARCMKAA